MLCHPADSEKVAWAAGIVVLLICDASDSDSVMHRPICFPPACVQESSALNDADDPGLCLDYNNDCVRWAAGGECEKNPVYMLGVASASGLGVGYQRPGTCRQACKFCQPCSADDRAAKAPCYWENRRDAGFLGFDPTEETAGAYQGGVALTL